MPARMRRWTVRPLGSVARVVGTAQVEGVVGG